MGKENNNRFYEDFDRVNRELNQITNGPKKEKKAIDPKRKIFDGEHDPDPSDVFDKWEREKKLNSVVASYPTSESNVDRKSTRLNSSHDRQSRMPSSA